MSLINNEKIDDYFGALMWACLHINVYTVELLLQTGINPNSNDGVILKNLRYYSLYDNLNEKTMRIYKLLIEYGLDVDNIPAENIIDYIQNLDILKLIISNNIERFNTYKVFEINLNNTFFKIFCYIIDNVFESECLTNDVYFDIFITKIIKVKSSYIDSSLKKIYYLFALHLDNLEIIKKIIISIINNFDKVEDYSIPEMYPINSILAKCLSYMDNLEYYSELIIKNFPKKAGWIKLEYIKNEFKTIPILMHEVSGEGCSAYKIENFPKYEI